MRRIAPAIPVPPTIFRHFAVITILITACIALFADGERRDAIGAELDAQKQKTVMVQAESGSLGPNKSSVKKVYYPARGGGGGDSGPPAGEPMVNPVGIAQNVAEQGTFRMARDFDYGRTDYNMSGPPGPAGMADNRQGKNTPPRMGSSRKNGGKGADEAAAKPTEAQRSALFDEGARRAGSPTPPD